MPASSRDVKVPSFKAKLRIPQRQHFPCSLNRFEAPEDGRTRSENVGTDRKPGKPLPLWPGAQGWTGAKPGSVIAIISVTF